MEQLMDFEEKDDYLFDHLIVFPHTGITARANFTCQPTCVTADPYTGHFYVGRYVPYIECLLVSVFSESGNIVKQFSREGLRYPVGIAIHQDNLYITLLKKPFLVHFNVADDLHLIRSREDIGSDAGLFDQFRRLAVSINGDVFVTDFGRHRVQILDGDLNYKRQISHSSMINPTDVKLTADEVFVLTSSPLHSHYYILLFDQMGSKLRSIIPRGLSERGLGNFPLYQLYPFLVFCLDSNGNFIINDAKTDEVKFFTKEGTLFQKLGESAAGPGKFCDISGLALTTNHKLAVGSYGILKLRLLSCF